MIFPRIDFVLFQIKAHCTREYTHNIIYYENLFSTLLLCLVLPFRRILHLSTTPQTTPFSSCSENLMICKKNADDGVDIVSENAIRDPTLLVFPVSHFYGIWNRLHLPRFSRFISIKKKEK